MEIEKIVVGVTTYGPIPRVNRFVRGFWSNIEPQLDISLIMVDDGTDNEFAIKERRTLCQRSNVTLVEHGKNRGIPASWNTIVKYALKEKAHMVCIFNDDIAFLAPGWITRLKFFLENNEKVGMVGLPLVNEKGFKMMEDRWNGTPGRVGAAVGCAFAVIPRVWSLIQNPDGSTGFYEDLISFHEEVDFGFELATQGFLSYMLPFPPVYHMGGATFQASPELVWRQPSSYLPMDEFLRYARQSKWFVKDYESAYAEGKADRMTYSRIMAAKKWGVLSEVDAGRRFQEIKGDIVDILDEPQRFRHAQVVDPWPLRSIRWLDKNARIQESEL